MTIKQINDIIDEALSLKLISEAYTEVATVKLQKLRQQVQNSRSFFGEVSQVYGLVRREAAQKNLELIPPKQTISLVLTSNYRFYGNINDALLRFYTSETTKYKTDRIIIGKMAEEFFTSYQLKLPYQLVKFRDDLPNPDELKNLGLMIKDYKQVLIFFSEFKSVLTQKPVIKDITQNQSSAINHQSSDKTKQSESLYIIEPEISQTLEFFNNQIRQVLLQQTFLEAELARAASRLISMDQAQTNAKSYLETQEKFLARAKRALSNLKLLETISNRYSIKYE